VRPYVARLVVSLEHLRGGEEGRGGEGLGGVNALKLYRHREKRICRLMLRATVDGKISTAVWSTGGRCSIKFILEGHVAW
jgi:hypothetical protein